MTRSKSAPVKDKAVKRATNPDAKAKAKAKTKPQASPKKDDDPASQEARLQAKKARAEARARAKAAIPPEDHQPLEEGVPAPNPKKERVPKPKKERVPKPKDDRPKEPRPKKERVPKDRPKKDRPNKKRVSAAAAATAASVAAAATLDEQQRDDAAATPADRMLRHMQRKQHFVRDNVVDICVTRGAALPVARGIERGVYNYAVSEARKHNIVRKWRNASFVKMYYRHSKSVVHNLTPTTLARIHAHEWAPYEFAHQTHQDWDPDKWHAYCEEKDRRDRKNGEGDGLRANDHATICGRCHQSKCYVNFMQTRSSDEPMTAYYTCVTCKHRWKG